MTYNDGEEVTEQIKQFEELTCELKKEAEKDVPSKERLKELLEEAQEKYDKIVELQEEI